MKKVIVFLMACSFLASCSKYEVCNKNCVDIAIKGRVLNMETNMGMANTLVTVMWTTSGFNFGGGSAKDIERIKTDNSGNFNLVISIDNSLFKGQHIEVRIPKDTANFLYIPTGSWNPFSSFDIDSIGSYNFLFNVYPKADLTYKIIRPTNSNILYGSISHSFNEENGRIGDFSSGNNLPSRDSLIRIETASGIYTKIFWTKYTAPGVYKDFKDSIRCKPNVENVFEIKF